MNEQTTLKMLELIHGFGELITALSVLLGVIFLVVFIYLLLELRKTGGSQQRNLGVAIPMTFLAAALFLQIGTTVEALQDTLFVSDGYYPSGEVPTTWQVGDRFSAQNQLALQARLILDLCALIGFAGIIRGILIMPTLGQSPMMGPQRGQIFMMVAFIVGGTAMMRITDVAQGMGYVIPLFKSFGDFLSQAA